MADIDKSVIPDETFLHYIREAAASLASLRKSVDHCAEILKDPETSEEEKSRAADVLKLANRVLIRTRYILGAKDAADMRKRYEKAGPLP